MDVCIGDEVEATIRPTSNDISVENDMVGELIPLSVELDVSTLKASLIENGYLYLKGFYDPEFVRSYRDLILDKLIYEGYADKVGEDKFKALKELDSGNKRKLFDSISETSNFINNQKLKILLQSLFEDEVKSLDFTGVRIQNPGCGTHPHSDIVYFQRGTQDLFTVWTPLTISRPDMGGLAFLEYSHLEKRLVGNYWSRDVDKYCVAHKDSELYKNNEKMWSGALSESMVPVSKKFDKKWLTSNYQVGDIVIFSSKIVHASFDNQTEYFRISIDPRYQKVSNKIDSRYVGVAPSVNGVKSKVGILCDACADVTSSTNTCIMDIKYV